MSCTITYNQKKYSEEYFRRKVGAIQSTFNNQHNLRGNREMLSIMKEDNLVDVTDKEKYGMLSTTGNASIVSRILKNAEVSLKKLSESATKELSALKENPGLTLAKKTVDDLGTALTLRDDVYEGMIEKLKRPVEQKAAEAGVSVEAMVDYESGEEDKIDIATEKKIKDYNKKLFTADERKLYDSIRRIYKLAFPLGQRAGKILSEDGFYADATDLVDEGVQRTETAKEKWAKVFGKNKVTKLLREATKKYAKIVAVDNILMKMGFEKGSAIFHAMYQAPNVSNRRTQLENAEQGGMMDKYLQDEKIARGTSYFTKLNYNNIQKEEIQFADKKVNMSIAEILVLHLTLKQDDIAEQFTYDKQRYDSVIKSTEQKALEAGVSVSDFKKFENKEELDKKTEDIIRAYIKTLPEPFKIRVREFGQRGESQVVLTDESLKQINEIADRAEYKELKQTIRTVLDQQYEKMSDTLFILTGQRLPQIDNYFPTYQASSKLSDFEKQQKALEDLRYIKERKNGLTVLDVQDVFSLMHNYIHSTNYYANMSVPLRNAKVVFDKMKEKGAFSGEFEHFQDIYGKWLNDMENNKAQLDYGDADKAMNKILRWYYKGTLGWNLPVVFKQPTSALHAWNFFGDIKYSQYMLDAYKYSVASQKKILAEIVEHNPIVRMYMENLASPELGVLFKTGGSGSAGAVVNTGVGGLVKKLGDAYVDKSMDLIRRADLASRIGLWNASKQFVTDKFKLTEKDGTAYWSMVAEMHNQANEATQQTWDLMHRSELGRSKNPFVRSLMMFTTQLQKHLSLLDAAMTNYTMYGRKEDRDNLIKTSASILIFQSIMVAAIDMGRDALLGYDDDDDKMMNLAAKTLSNNLAVIPFMQIFANDVTNAIMGTDLYTKPVSIPLTDMATTLQDAIAAASNREGNVNDNMADLFEITWKEGSKYAGIPLAPFRQFETYQKNNEE